MFTRILRSPTILPIRPIPSFPALLPARSSRWYLEMEDPHEQSIESLRISLHFMEDNILTGLQQLRLEATIARLKSDGHTCIPKYTPILPSCVYWCGNREICSGGASHIIR
jgi:hypothetical protein